MAPPSANDFGGVGVGVDSHCSGRDCHVDAHSDPPSSPDSLTSDPNISAYPISAFKEPTLTLYDWDDTFLPSTYLAALGLRVDEDSLLPASLSKELRLLEDQVIQMLQESIKYGNVKIVTNAEEGWVQLSGRRFMPNLINFLTQHHIKVISARSAYESAYPDLPSSWKTAAFISEVSENNRNILVLGDSLSERDAAHALAGRLPDACIKSVKLVERPNVAQLQRQIQLLYRSFRDLRDHPGSFDVNLTC